MKYDRVYNFGPGPSPLPLEVLEKAAEEMFNCRGSGMSVMEMSHRSKEYQAIIDEAERDLRKLMDIPDNYKVLFLQGGASTQFAAIPLNLLKTGKADYVISGNFSKKAYEEACKYGEIRVIGNSKDDKFSYIPKNLKTNPDSDYLHICFNNTIYGTQYNEIPDTDLPIVADVSSCILGRKIDVSKFAVLYAGAQKNMGIAGLTVVIVREDMLGNASLSCPTMLNWKVMADNGSMYNTPPCFAIYMAGLMFKWLLEKGGVEEIEKVNLKKAGLLYDFLDSSKLFKPVARKEDRSIMNVTFITGNEDMDKKFADEARKNNFISVKGHRVVGGMRVSLYNAVTLEAVEKLVAFMKKFEEENYEG